MPSKDASPFHPWIIDKIKKREKEREWQPDQLELPVGDERPDDEGHRDPGTNNGYTEPNAVPKRKRPEPVKENSDHGVAEIEIGTPDPGEDEGEAIPLMPLNIITTNEIGVDPNVTVNPDMTDETISSGDVIEDPSRSEK